MSVPALTFADDIHSVTPAACPSWFRTEIFEKAENITMLVTLGLINAVVVGGNLLVILAVFASAKLRTVTNFLIVSLAASDLLVGLAVLPYSITLELLDVWIYGKLWCQVWLAIDVWLCTASILNLCAISIDRYLAITRPMHYRAIMSSGRVKLLIAFVWILSFIICFPPLVGWNDTVKDDEDIMPYSNVTFLSSLSNNKETPNNNTSFALTNASIRYGDRKHSTDLFDISLFSSSNFSEGFAFGVFNSSDETKYFIKSMIRSRCPRPKCALISNKGYVIYSALGSFYIPMFIMLFFYWKIYVAALKTSRALSRGFKTSRSSRVKAGSENLTLRIHRGKPVSESSSTSQQQPSRSATNANRKQGDILVPRRLPTVVYHHTKEYSSPRCFREHHTKEYYTTTTTSSTNSATAKTSPAKEDPGPSSSYTRLLGEKATSFVDKKPSSSTDNGLDRLTVNPEGSEKSGKNIFSRISKRSVRWQAKRFKTEAKATKTVGIIVGAFILCWLPFFTVYLIVAFCDDCIPDMLFKVFFYLGYCNSALNPIIYAMVSKDFRFAFKKILCRCKLKDDGVSSLIRQIHLPSFFEEEDAVVTEAVSEN